KTVVAKSQPLEAIEQTLCYRGMLIAQQPDFGFEHGYTYESKSDRDRPCLQLNFIRIQLAHQLPIGIRFTAGPQPVGCLIVGLYFVYSACLSLLSLTLQVSQPNMC